jgi:hypothetical protein
MTVERSAFVVQLAIRHFRGHAHFRGIDHYPGECTPHQRVDLDLALAFNRRLAAAINECRDVSGLEHMNRTGTIAEPAWYSTHPPRIDGELAWSSPIWGGPQTPRHPRP